MESVLTTMKSVLPTVEYVFSTVKTVSDTVIIVLPTENCFNNNNRLIFGTKNSNIGIQVELLNVVKLDFLSDFQTHWTI